AGLPEGVQATSLAEATRSGPRGELARRHLARYAPWQDSAFAALNTAFLADGAFVHVAADTVLAQPLEVLFLATSGTAVTGAGGSQHADHHTVIDHARPHCASHEFFNGVLAERAHGVFNGRIIVRPGAQRTDSKQTNNNLLLSTEARADSQPQLEIYADDVKCTHGSTVGPIDQTQLYYLRSRGLSPEAARSILT